MAILIPKLGDCTFDSAGEGRFASRALKLGADVLAWYNVPINGAASHPDFLILHPRKGLLVLEVKDWTAGSIVDVDPSFVSVRTNGGVLKQANPIEQARRAAHHVVDVLKKNEHLTFGSGPHRGQLIVPWSFGVVLPCVTRKQFTDAQLGLVIPSERVLCRDEMTEAVGPDALEKRLWNMMPRAFQCDLSESQVNLIRWCIHPEVRPSARQGELFDKFPTLDQVRVLDLQQEQLARAMASGHRVLHGVAGSGKTVILLHRAIHLAKGATKPLLVVCFNEALEKWLQQTLRDRGVEGRVHAFTFHRWCRSQLVQRGVKLPRSGGDKGTFFAEMVRLTQAAAEDGRIAPGQYSAVFIDEAHDLHPDWLRLLVRMVDPATKNLLVAFDDVQSIYSDARPKSDRKFSFKSVGIEAVGRTTVLRVNYRNTSEILHLARSAASQIFRAVEATEDGIPVLVPQSAARNGELPRIEKLRDSREELEFIVKYLKSKHRAKVPWRHMAVICRRTAAVASAVDFLRSYGVPCVHFREARFSDDEDQVVAVTMHSAKGLEFPVVAIPAVDEMESPEGGLSPEEARLLYVAITRATQHLLLTGKHTATK